MSIDQIVKLGGSAITLKRRKEKLNKVVLNALSEQLGRTRTKKRIMVHGAGSFGHFQASEYELSEGNHHPQFPLGFADTRRAVFKLNLELLESFIQAGLYTVTISPYSTSRLRGGEIKYFDENIFTQTMELGVTPLTHGDVVFDELLGTTILSGDLIVERLALDLKPKRVLFLTDVDGVFKNFSSRGSSATKEGREDDQLPIPEIRVKSINDLDIEMTSLSHDVTMGIKAKLRSAILIANSGIPVYILRAGSMSSLQALQGKEPEVATKVLAAT